MIFKQRNGVAISLFGIKVILAMSFAKLSEPQKQVAALCAATCFWGLYPNKAGDS